MRIFFIINNMKLDEYINFDVLFLTMCFFVAIRYFNSEEPRFVVKYK